MVGSESESASSTGEETTSTTNDPTTTTGTLSNSSTPTDTLETTTSPMTESSSSTGVGCEPSFDPLPPDGLPRCEAATLECWVSCPGVDPHECTSGCAAADPTPSYELPDGSTVDCGRCINKLFGICWHEACPEEVELTRCCTLTSGCDPQCIGFGPCDTEDLACIAAACGPELNAQTACLMETGALQSCRVEQGGLPTQCFAE